MGFIQYLDISAYTAEQLSNGFWLKLQWAQEDGTLVGNDAKLYNVKFTVTPKTYGIDTSSITNGAVTASVDGTNPAATAKAGDEVTLTVAPSEGYALANNGLTVNGGDVAVSGSNNNYTFTMPDEDVTVAATFEAIDYTVTVNGNGNGCTVTPSKTTDAHKGDTITLAVTVAEGYELTSLTAADANGGAVTIDGSGATNRSFTMPAANVTVTATFTQTTVTPTAYTLTLPEGVTATVDSASVSSGGTVEAGKTVTLTVAAPAKQHLKEGSLKYNDGTDHPLTPDGQNQATFTMPAAAVTVTAEFEDDEEQPGPVPTTYTVTVNNGANGTVTADQTTDVAQGDTVTLTIAPSKGYELDALTVKDAANAAVTVNGTGNSRTFTMPASNVTVSATFKSTGGTTPVDPDPTPVDPTPVDPTPVDPDPTPAEPVVKTETAADGTVTTTTTWDDGKKAVAVQTPEGDTDITVTASNGESIAAIEIPAEPTVTKTFKDVKTGAWYENSVTTATGYGLFNGTSETKFSPEAPMTRGMLATVLHNLSGKPAYGTGAGTFEDVKDGIWYENPVDWAYKTGVTSGTGANQFSPNQNITREQLVTMLYNYAQAIGATSKNRTGLTDFPDSGKVAGYAQDAMQWAVAEGFISGRAQGGKNYIAPKGTATRAEVAAVLAKFVEYLK